MQTSSVIFESASAEQSSILYAKVQQSSKITKYFSTFSTNQMKEQTKNKLKSGEYSLILIFCCTPTLYNTCTLYTSFHCQHPPFERHGYILPAKSLSPLKVVRFFSSSNGIMNSSFAKNSSANEFDTTSTPSKLSITFSSL